MIFLGISAFALMALGDLNDLRFEIKLLKLCFPIGFILLAAATYFACDFYAINIVWCAASGVFLLLLLCSLFGSLSVKEAYVEQKSGRRVCDRGLYAVCRHPGVLFFTGLYICLHFAIGLPTVYAAVYIAMNILLAFFEDKVIFPKVLEGYDEYQMRVPFILPTIESLRNTIKR